MAAKLRLGAVLAAGMLGASADEVGTSRIPSLFARGCGDGHRLG